VATLLALTACGGGGGSTGPSKSGAKTATVTVSKASFSPQAVTVGVNATVTWRWNTCSTTGGSDPYGGGTSTTTCVTHNIVFDDGAESPSQQTGSFVRTFAQAGTFPYHCRIHGTAMSGSVTVQ
jgi:plastocyanin